MSQKDWASSHICVSHHKCVDVCTPEFNVVMCAFAGAVKMRAWIARGVSGQIQASLIFVLIRPSAQTRALSRSS